jgi:tetratricopeptide (TPR) repeat protein
MLGDLLLEIDADVPGALAEYEFAFEHAPRPEFLARRLSALMQLDAPDFAAVVSLVEAQSDAVRGHPAVMALHARALSGLGRRDESRELMARSYRTYEEMSAQGIMTPEGLAFWLAQASVLAAGRGPGEVEAVVTELAGATPAPIVLRNLAREHARAGDEVSVDRAIALQQSAIDRSEALSGEARAQMLIELASYCILAGRYAEAASLFEETMSLVPSNMAVVNNFAYLLVEYLGRADDALRHAERAHAMAPADPDALDTLGWVHFKLGNLQQAMNYLETSLRTRESVSAHVHLAAVLLAQGDLDRAAQSLINAQRMRPTEQKQGEIDRLKADIDRQRAAGDPVRPDDG